MEDYYSILELPQGASPDEIKSSYRRLAMKWHPDRNPGSKEAEERFKKIAEAYSILSDEDKRRNYDAWKSAGGTETGRRPEDWNAGASGAYGPADGAYGSDAAFAAFWQFAQAAAAASAAGGSASSRTRGFGFDYGWAGEFTAEQAEDMFMQEMYALASELTMQNVSWKDIAQELERRGCPKDVAAATAKRFEDKRKTLIRARARPYFLRSALEGGAGLLLFGTFAGLGLGILGFIGLFMFLSGGYNLIRALYFLTTGRAPRS